MTETNWEAEAKRAAGIVRDRLIEAHRGATAWHTPTATAMLFANDGHAREHVKYLCLRCVERGVDVLGVSSTNDEYSFAMLVAAPMLKSLSIGFGNLGG